MAHGATSGRMRPLMRRMMAITATSLGLAAVANALSPVGIPWVYDWSRDVWNQALLAGYSPVSPVEARRLVESGSLFIADARDPESFAAGHIPGAVPVPWQVAREFLLDQSRKLPLDTPILVYCSGADCDAALVVADFFQATGYADISILVEGWPGWLASNGPVEAGLQ